MYHFDSADNRSQLRFGYFVGAPVTNEAFGAQYYSVTYSDIAASNVDPYSHYMTGGGWQQNRAPCAFFSTSGYRAAYTDIANANINPLAHYNSYGWREGRDLSGLFKTQAYLSAYPDIANANNPLMHFLQAGIWEGRQPFGNGSYAFPN